VGEVGLGRFGELSQGQVGFLTAKGNVGTDPNRYLLIGGAVEVGRLDDLLVLVRGFLTGDATVPRPFVDPSCRPAAIAEGSPRSLSLWTVAEDGPR